MSMKIIKNLRTALDAANKFTDPRWKEDDIHAEQQALRNKAITEARRDLNNITETKRVYYEATKTKVYADLNTVPTADAATMGKMAWERTAMLLDAGRDLNSIISAADATEARAIATWAPTWWKINHPLDPSTRNANMLYGKSGEPETDWILDAVADRLGELEPKSVPAMLSPDRVELERAELLERIGVGIATGQLEAVIEVSRAIPGFMQDINPEAYTSNGNVRAAATGHNNAAMYQHGQLTA